MNNAPSSPFAIRDFRLLWLGEAISSLGDQFALIALPWLALVLTGSALALGGVLALMAVPRALLMIVGGAYVDRFSPRVVMLGSNTMRLVAVGVLAVIVLAGSAQLWMLYVFALLFGIADAFFYPAQSAIVPELVDAPRLQQANALVQGTAQASLLLGPAVAGGLIAVLGQNGANPGMPGIGAALLVDAGTFVVSLITLLLITRRVGATSQSVPVTKAIREGIAFVWRSRTLRFVMLLSACLNLLLVGPIEVGLPVLAYSRLPEGAAAFGLIMSGFGGGSLLGLAAGAMLPSPRPAAFAPVILGALAISGLGVTALAFTDSTALALLAAAVSGFAIGYTNLLVITWVQLRIPSDLMGRVLSLLTLGSVALVPLSELVAGAAVQLSFVGMLIVAGCGMAAVSLGSLLSVDVREMGLQPIVARGDSGDEVEPAVEAAPAGS
jgi:MFS family permease